MAVLRAPLRLLIICVVGVLADPAPGRVPKVYNALITSNQNLEPSKAFPVYQPVIHDAFALPFQPALFYGGDFPGVLPAAALPPNGPQTSQAPSSTPQPPVEVPTSTESQTSSTPAPSEEPKAAEATPAAPAPPHTESPIPLNEFGLPPQVLPLGSLNPGYHEFARVGPIFNYHYPGLRFYDPYSPFNFNPYTGFNVYRPVLSLFGHNDGIVPQSPAIEKPKEDPTNEATPPPEPGDLNVLNYSSKDPAIPDVPPPPLPQGGLKSDKDE